MGGIAHSDLRVVVKIKRMTLCKALSTVPGTQGLLSKWQSASVCESDVFL